MSPAYLYVVSSLTQSGCAHLRNFNLKLKHYKGSFPIKAMAKTLKPTDWPFAQYPDILISQKIATLNEDPRLKSLAFETQNIKA